MWALRSVSPRRVTLAEHNIATRPIRTDVLPAVCDEGAGDGRRAVSDFCVCDVQDVISLLVLAGVLVFAAAMFILLFRP